MLFQVKQLRDNIVGVPTSFTKSASEGLRNIEVLMQLKYLINVSCR